MERPFARSYWVVPGKILAGAFPDVWNDDAAALTLRGLPRVGIRTTLNLTEEGELNESLPLPDYAEPFARFAAEMGVEVACERRAIHDFDVPTVADLAATLDVVDAAVATNKPVYIHCRGGWGRTGTVVGCYLVRHGLASPGEALAELQRLRDTQGQTGDSPQTDAQRDMVRGWGPGQ